MDCAKFYNVLTVCFYTFCCKFKGLENSWERHEKVVEYFHAGLENMGLKLFVENKVSLEFVIFIIMIMIQHDKEIKRTNSVTESEAADSHNYCCSSWI